MVLLAWVVFMMWTLIIERLLFMLSENRVGLKKALAEREIRRDRDSWYARAIYDAVVSRLCMRLESRNDLIRSLARLCPLFGLLGTVTGMILIFEVMASIGSSSPRAMAAGVAKATLTTMAGMVGAISGIFPAAILRQMAQDQRASLKTHRQTSATISLSPISALPQVARWIIAPMTAFATTMGLIFLMQTLIETGEAAIQKTVAANYVEFIRVRREERVDKRTAKPKKIMPAEMPETVDPRVASEPGEGIVIGYSMARPSSDSIDLSGLIGDFGSPDGEFLPLVRVLPIYPRRAQIQGLEGWVMVEFTITVMGTVRDIRVIESSHEIFEVSAVRAVEKFKYRPRIVNGQAIAVTNVLHRVRYDIEG